MQPMQPMQPMQQQQQQQQQQGGEVAATPAVCPPANGAPPVARTLFPRDEADRVATDEEKRVDEVAKLIEEKVDEEGSVGVPGASPIDHAQRLALASYPTDDEGRLQLAAGCVAVAEALLDAARPKDGQQPKRLALAWTEHAHTCLGSCFYPVLGPQPSICRGPEHEGALWWQHEALEELDYLAAAHARLSCVTWALAVRITIRRIKNCS